MRRRLVLSTLLFTLCITGASAGGRKQTLYIVDANEKFVGTVIQLSVSAATTILPLGDLTFLGVPTTAGDAIARVTVHAYGVLGDTQSVYYSEADCQGEFFLNVGALPPTPFAWRANQLIARTTVQPPGLTVYAAPVDSQPFPITVRSVRNPGGCNNPSQPFLSWVVRAYPTVDLDTEFVAPFEIRWF